MNILKMLTLGLSTIYSVVGLNSNLKDFKTHTAGEVTHPPNAYIPPVVSLKNGATVAP